MARRRRCGEAHSFRGVNDIDLIRSTEQDRGMTYKRLLETAIEHFGRKGYEGASTREIAAASGTAMSSITYHFGGKEGLYLAVADHIAEQITRQQAPTLDAAWEKSVTSRAQAMEVLANMVESFARLMLAPESAAWSGFIVREQQEPTAAFERLYDGAMRDMVEMFVALIAIARPDLDEDEARMTGIFLYGQSLILRVGHASVCRTLEMEVLTARTQEALLARLRANTLAVLSGADAPAPVAVSPAARAPVARGSASRVFSEKTG